MPSVLLALGSNLGDRRRNLRLAVGAVSRFVDIVRLSSVWETSPLGSPPGSPDFLNMVLAGATPLSPEELLGRMLEAESRLGRRRSIPDAPRTIDIDLILYGSAVMRTEALTLPHPRFRAREFVLAPLRELGLPWVDPRDGKALASLRGEGVVGRAGALY